MGNPAVVIPGMLIFPLVVFYAVCFGAGWDLDVARENYYMSRKTARPGILLDQAAAVRLCAGHSRRSTVRTQEACDGKTQDLAQTRAQKDARSRLSECTRCPAPRAYCTNRRIHARVVPTFLGVS